MKPMSEQVKIGQRIRQVFDEKPKSCDVAWFAARLHCDRRNVYRIFERDNIDIMLLFRISKILNHDFFAELSNILDQSKDGEDAFCLVL